MAMEMHPVASSNIAEVGHDPETNTLRVVFKGGAIYDYVGVPAIIAEGCWKLSSAGKYLNEAIKKGGYEYHKVS